MMRRSRGRERSICTAAAKVALSARRCRARKTPIKVRTIPPIRNPGVTIQVRMLM